MSNKHTPGKWLECGCGILLHPVTEEQLQTLVVEQEGFGRIFEVFHYGNDPEGTQRLIESAPELLAALEEMAKYWPAQKPNSPAFNAYVQARAAIQKATKS